MESVRRLAMIGGTVLVALGAGLLISILN